ncbi:MAG: TrkA family potassium uptake protein [Sedimentisphaerales bacterium]|nr:TrkA family potassium uptake protein [Sedimentisphaerales bacterium]
MRRFAVIGLGRFGGQLARALARGGSEVIAIDKDRKLVEAISNDVAVAVRLDSTDEEALRAQGVDKVDVAVVGIGQDFANNILTTVTLKSLGVKRICARAEQPTHGKILRRIGADEIIYPEEESALRWAFKLATPQISEKLEFAPGFSLAQYSAPAGFHGKSLAELNLRKKYRVNLISLRRAAEGESGEGEIISVPLPETIIHAGDTLWLVGADDDMANLPDK